MSNFAVTIVLADDKKPSAYWAQMSSATVLQIILFIENCHIFIQISLRFVPKDPVDNIPGSFLRMASNWTGDKPLYWPMMAYLVDEYMYHSTSMSLRRSRTHQTGVQRDDQEHIKRKLEKKMQKSLSQKNYDNCYAKKQIFCSGLSELTSSTISAGN